MGIYGYIFISNVRFRIEKQVKTGIPENALLDAPCACSKYGYLWVSENNFTTLKPLNFPYNIHNSALTTKKQGTKKPAGSLRPPG